MINLGQIFQYFTILQLLTEPILELTTGTNSIVISNISS